MSALAIPVTVCHDAPIGRRMARKAGQVSRG